MPLVGKRTLFDATLRRLRALTRADRILVIAADAQKKPIRAELKRSKGTQLLLEPEGRNTAAAIAWGAAVVASKTSDAVIAVFPADHHIPDTKAFVSTLRNAAKVAARHDEIILVGVEPSMPSTAYGYLQISDESKDGICDLLQFIEKPDIRRAQEFLAVGKFLWNAGMLVARAEVILDQVAEHCPEVWKALGPKLELIRQGRRVPRDGWNRAYRRVQPISFDYGVLERTKQVRAIRAGFAWSDLGSWDSLGEHLPEKDGNRVSGAKPLISIDAKNNVVWSSSEKAVALVGVEGIVVAETEDAILVCDLNRAQDIRLVVEELERRRRRDLT